MGVNKAKKAAATEKGTMNLLDARGRYALLM